MSNIFHTIKLKWQFGSYVKGYSRGYEQGAKRCAACNGMFVRLSGTDIEVRSGFVKKPVFGFLKVPWRSGFELGYTEAVSDYNSGDTPIKVSSFNDILASLKQEFDKDFE